MYRIMIVEDDPKIANIMRGHLTKYGYEIEVTEKFDDVKGEVAKNAPSLILLDVNLPRYDGFYWCRQIRVVSTAPVIFISARTGEMDQVMAIENGGDDYITKPFSLDLLLAKVKSALRRAYGEYATIPAVADVKEINGLFLIPAKNQVEWNGKSISLTHNEFLLLDCLIKKPGRIVSRQQILESLWDDVHFVDDNTLSVNVNRVRKKLEHLGISDVIETVRGQGYRLSVSWGSEYDF